MVTDAPAVAGPEETRTDDDGPPPEAAPGRPRAAAGAREEGEARAGFGGRAHAPGALVLAAYWIASRLVMVAMLRQGFYDVGGEVERTYQQWVVQFGEGAFPGAGDGWQYPPGAALVLIAPVMVPGLGYGGAFVLMAVLADAAVLLMLARAGARSAGGSQAGAWTWALALPLLLTLPYARFDVIVTAAAVAALLCLSRRPRLGGALAGLGAVLKVWPLLTLLGAERGRTARSAWQALAMAAAAVLLPMALLFRDSFGFLAAQRERGVEIESLGGSVLYLARLAGWSGHIVHRHGSFEFAGPYVSAVATVSLLLAGAAVGWLLLWRLCSRTWTEATPYDAALAAVLLLTVTSRVISPQYLVWLMGLAAVCLTASRTTQRPVAVLLLLATAATTAEYPVFFTSLLNGDWQGTAVIVVRNLLLLAAALLSCVRLWRSTVSDGPGGPVAG